MSKQHVEAIERALPGATAGPWVSDSDWVFGPNGEQVANVHATFASDAVYIAAANPEALRAILDRLAEAEKNEARYLWMQQAGAWESEVGIWMLRDAGPAAFDAAVDAQMEADRRNAG